MDGYLKIKTKIDNKEVDKQIKELENKMKKLQESNTQNAKQQEALETELRQYEDLTQKVKEYEQILKKLEHNRKNMVKTNPQLAVSATPTPEYSNLKGQIEEMRQKYTSATKELEKQSPKIDKVYMKLEQVKAKQTENNAKITQFKQKIESVNTNNIQKGVDNVGKSLTRQIKKIGKLGMAVIGIRSAWYAVRGAINSVSQYNDQVSTDFEYMRYAIAQALLPAVQQLVKILYTVLTYVNAITSAWFGFNMFANASTKSFQKMKSSASAIQKSLQGFDEMNTVSSSSSSSSSSGMPSMDLTGPKGEVPAWLKFIIDNKDLIISTIGGIAGAVVLLKLGLGGIKALEIGLLIGEIIQLLQDLKKLIEEPTWENFGKVIFDIGLIILTLGVIIGSVPAMIAGALTLIIGYMIAHWDELKEGFKLLGEFIVEIFWSLISAIEGIFTIIALIVRAPFDTLWDVIQGVCGGIKTTLKGILQVFKGIFTGDMRTVLEGFKNIFKGIFDSLWSIAKAPINLIIRGINALISGINTIKFDVPNWVPGIGGKRLGFNVPKIPLLARGTVVSNPTPAIIGEAGAEAVVPLENNLEWLDKMASMLASKIGGNGTVNVYLDGRLIQRQMAKKQQELAFATNS